MIRDPRDGGPDQRFESLRVVQFSAVRVWCTCVEYDVQTKSSAIGDGVMRFRESAGIFCKRKRYDAYLPYTISTAVHLVSNLTFECGSVSPASSWMSSVTILKEMLGLDPMSNFSFKTRELSCSMSLIL